MKPRFHTWKKSGKREFSLIVDDITDLSVITSAGGVNSVSFVTLSKADIIQFIQDIHLEWARAQALVSEQEAKA